MAWHRQCDAKHQIDAYIMHCKPSLLPNGHHKTGFYEPKKDPEDRRWDIERFMGSALAGPMHPEHSQYTPNNCGILSSKGTGKHASEVWRSAHRPWPLSSAVPRQQQAGRQLKCKSTPTSWRNDTSRSIAYAQGSRPRWTTSNNAALKRQEGAREGGMLRACSGSTRREQGRRKVRG